MHYFLLILSFLFALNVAAHEAHTLPQKSTLAISAVFDSAGVLWRASVQDGFVQVDKSADLGKTFFKAVKVHAEAQKIGADGEARPKLAIGPEGNIYLTWTQMLKKPFTGFVWFARSVDGGKSFEAKIVHQNRDEITHRFDALHVSANGNITVTWIDKRDLEAAKAAGKKYDGAAIYYAVSADQGLSFKQEQKLADSTCECCRIATASKPDGTVVALWRHVFEGSERDHMIAEIPAPSTALQASNHAASSVVVRRATFGHWVIDGCPHHGAAIASGGEGKDWWGYHMAYFDGNDKKPGLYYSRMDGVAWASSPAKKFGDNAKQAGHPALLSVGEKVWLVWREIKDGKTSILGMLSEDGGKLWGEVKMLVETDAKADYPLLLNRNQRIFLLVNAEKQGLIVKSLP